MAGFNLIAQLQLQSPSNLDRVVGQIKNSVKNITADIDVRINPTSNSNLKGLNQQVNILNSSLKQLRVNADAASNSLSGLSRGFGNFGSASNNSVKSLQNAITTTKKLSETTKEASDATEEFGRTAGLAGRRFLGFSLVAGSIVAAMSAIKNGVGEALKFEREFVKISQLGGVTKNDLNALNSEITKLSTNLGVSSKDLIATSVTLRQAGLSVKEVTSAMEVLAKTTLAPSFDNIKDTTEGAIAIMAQFRIEAKNLEGALASANSVANAFAVESKDVITAVQRAGGAFRSVGGELNEFIALFTSVRSTTRESAESISTGLRTIFTRLQRRDTVEALKELGINLRATREEALALGQADLENQFVGGYEAVRRLSEGLKGLRTTDPRYSEVIEQLGGYRQISKVIPLIQEFATSQKALNIAQAGFTSITSASEEAQQTFVVKLQKVREEFLALARTIVGSNAFKGFLDTTLSIAKGFIAITESISPLIPLLTALAAVKLGTGFASFFGGVKQGLSGISPTRIAQKPITLASGGIVPGQGSGDTVPAMLTPGEFVVNQGAAKSIGYGKLHNMNKFAAGGPVQKFKVGAYDLSENNMKFLYQLANAKDGGASLIEKNQAALKGLFGVPTNKSGNYEAAKDVFNKLGFPGQNLTEFRKTIEANKTFVKTRNEAIESGNYVNNGNLVIPFKGETMGYVASGNPGGEINKQGRDSLNAGLRQETLNISNLGEKTNKTAKTLLKEAGVKSITGGVNVHILSNSPTKDFNEGVVKDVEKNIQDIYLNKFGAGRVAPLSRAQTNTISGYLFEKYIEGVSGKMTAGNESGFEYTKQKPGSTLGKAFDSFIFPSPAQETYLDLKSRFQRDHTGDVMKKYLNAKTNDGTLTSLLGIKGQSQDTAGLAGKGDASSAKLRLNSGGVVPGQGNSDTVPAVLTPGEFVIKKSSAQAIGYGKLHGMNHYADGGNIKSLPKRERISNKNINGTNFNVGIDGAAVGLVAQKGGSSPVSLQDIDINSFKGKNYPAPIAQLVKELRDGGVKEEDISKYIRVNGLVQRGALNEKVFENFRTNVVDETRKSVNKILSDVPPIRGNVAPVLNEQSLGSVIGNVFELYVNRLTGTPQGGDKPNFDYTGVNKSQLKAFNKVFDGGLTASYLDAKLNDSSSAQKDIVRKGLNEGIYTTSTFLPNVSTRVKRASGGNTTDTVPAMLTPGEFVISKGAASNIGLSNLQHMNQTGKVRGYAGGGEVQYFTRGGRPDVGSGYNISNTYSPPSGIIDSHPFYRDYQSIANTGRDLVSERNRVKTLEQTPINVSNLEKLNSELKVLSKLFLDVQTAAKKAGISVNPLTKVDYSGNIKSGYKVNSVVPSAYEQSLTERKFKNSFPVNIKNTKVETDTLGRISEYGIQTVKQRDELRKRLKDPLNTDKDFDASRLKSVEASLAKQKRMFDDILQTAKKTGVALAPDTVVSRRFTKFDVNNPSFQNQRYVETVGLKEGNESKAKREIKRLEKLEEKFAALKQTPLESEKSGRLRSGFSEFFLGSKELNEDGTKKRASLASRVGDRIAGPGLIALSLGAGYGSQLFENKQTDFENAAKNQSTADKVRSNAGNSGALTGAAAGAAFGSAFGPLGTVVGLVAGGLFGMTSSLKDAEKEIKSAKIGKAITDLTETIQKTIKSNAPLDAATRASIVSNIGIVRSEARGKAALDSTNGFFSGLNPFTKDRPGLDISKYSASYDTELRRSLGKELPELFELLNRESKLLGENFAKTNTDLDGLPFAEVKKRLEDLDKGFIEANRDLLAPIAALKKVSIEDIAKDFRRSRVEGFTDVRRKEIDTKTVIDVGQQLNSLSRLASAAENTANSMARLQANSSALSDLFDGIVGSSGLVTDDKLSSLTGGSSRKDFASAIGGLSGVGGKDLVDFSLAFDNIKSNLSSVLVNVLSNANQLDKEDIGIRVREGLTAGLGNRKLNPQEEAIISSISRQAGGTPLDELKVQGRTDINKLIEKLISEVNPTDSLNKILESLAQNANRYTTELGKQASRLKTIGESEDRLRNIQLARFRNSVEQQARLNGTPGSAYDRISASELNRPLTERARSLTGLGNNAENPEAIASRLKVVQGEIIKAAEEQQKAFDANKFQNQATRDAADKLVKLKVEASNLQTALKDLTDVATRNAAAQEKLNNIQQDRSSRLGFGEKFLSSGFSERAEINRGLRLTQAAARQGNLNGFSPENSKRVLETLNSLGNAKLTGLGGIRANDLKNKLVQSTFGGVFDIDADSKKEEVDLIKAISENFAKAEAAQKLLIESQKDINQKLADDLRKLQDEFFNRLEKNIRGEEIKKVEQKIIDDKGQLGDLNKGRGQAKEFLEVQGIRGQGEVDFLKGNKDIGALREATVNQKLLEEKYKNITGTAKGFETGAFLRPGETGDTNLLNIENFKVKVADFIKKENQEKNLGLSDEDITLRTKNVVGKSIAGVTRRSADGEFKTFGEDKIRSILEQELKGAILGKADAGGKTVRDLQGKILGENRVGKNVIDNIKNLDEAGYKKFIDSLNQFDAKSPLNKFASEVEVFEERILQSEQRLRGLKTAQEQADEKSGFFGRVGKDVLKAALPVAVDAKAFDLKPGFNINNLENLGNFIPKNGGNIRDDNLFRPGGPKREISDNLFRPGESKSVDTGLLDKSFQTFGANIGEMQSVLNIFSSSVAVLEKAMNTFPATIKGDFTHNVNMNISGAEAFASMMPEIEKLVVSKGKELLSNYVKNNIPEAGLPT